MKEKKWVRHISGQGEKWEVVSDWHNEHQWAVRSGPVPCGYHFLPKSEYVECEPPEEWVDVTEEFYATENWPSERLPDSNGIANNDNNMFWVPSEMHNRGYGLRKVQLWDDGTPGDAVSGRWAFIIERKK
jgi:hypothetical protein